MAQISNKIIQNFEKLSRYWILSHENDNFTVATTINFTEDYINNNDPFRSQPCTIERRFPTFFLLTTSKEETKTENFFDNHKLPILIIYDLKTIKTHEQLQEVMDKFLIERYKSYPKP